MLWLVLLAGAALGLVGVLLWRHGGERDETSVTAKLGEIPGFAVSALYIHHGTGICADEPHGRIAVLGEGRDRVCVLGARDIARWYCRTIAGQYRITVMSRRHEHPFELRFADARTADEWLALLRRLTEEH